MASRFAGFEHTQVAGCPVLFLRDRRFKTFRVVLAMQRPLDQDQAARALLPALLQHGTAAHPSRMALARHKEMLYGAWTGPSVGRHGESVLLRLQAEAIAGEFLPGRPDQFGAALDLVRQYATEPLLPDRLPPALFARQQAQALAAARAVFDDKSAWARQQALLLACRGEPYGILEHGGEAALAQVTAAAAARMLQDFLGRGRRFCVAMGALPDPLAAALQPWLAALPAAAGEPPPPPVAPARRPPAQVRERAAMQQAKVVLVLRAPVPASIAEHCALQTCLSLWGGGAHSRLFREVREKRSLCYYAAAAADPRKGIVMVQIGCDPGAVAAVVQETMAQLADLAGGRFDAQELQTTVAAITGVLQSIDDALATRLSFTAEQWLLGQDQDPDGRIAAYRAVTAEAVAAAAASLWLDHDYALLPEGPP